MMMLDDCEFVEEPEHSYMYVDVPDAAYYEEYGVDSGGEGNYEGGHDYGGMDDEMYHGIILYKTQGTIPDFILGAEDRNARSHWKQAAVLQCFYWRSVRADVQRFVGSCQFCNKKKMQGKKVLRAPIDAKAQNSTRLATKNPLKLVHIPLGHSLDGFHEIHTLPSISGKDLFPQYWLQEREACKRTRGRRKTYERQASYIVIKFFRNFDQIRGAAEALKHLSSGRRSPDDYDNIGFDTNEFSESKLDASLPFFNGLAARYNANNHLRKDSRGLEEEYPSIYEIDPEHWHLPPTYEN